MDKMNTEDEDNNTSLDLASHAKKKLFELGKALGSSLDFHESENLTRNLATADEEATLQILIIVQEFVRCMARRMESDNVAGAVEDKTKDKRKGLIKRMILELEEQGKYIRKEILTQALNCSCISELNTGHLLLILDLRYYNVKLH